MLRNRNGWVGVWTFSMSLMTAVPGVPAPLELVSKIPPRISPETAGGDSYTSRIDHSLSADGRFLVFSSSAANLVPGQVDLNSDRDVFLYDRIAGTTTLVSHVPGSAPATVAGDAYSDRPAISADGRFVAFLSNARNLVAGQSGPEGAVFNVFLYERETGRITLVTRRAGSVNVTAGGTTGTLALSADGSYVAFTSTAPDLVPGQTPGRPDPLTFDVFLFERSTGTTRLVSHSAVSPSRTGNGPSDQPALSADGRFVAFTSRATDLVAGQNDSNQSPDVFLYDRLTDASALVSHASSSALRTGDQGSFDPSLSADGRFVAFAGPATDLVTGVGGAGNVFLYDRLLGTVARVASSDLPVSSPVLSADGGVIAYFAGDRGSFEGARLFLFDRLAGTSSLLASGAVEVALSADGRYVAFTSRAADLVAGQADANGRFDVFVHDRLARATALVSHAGDSRAAGEGESLAPDISADGSWIAFSSFADDLVAGRRDTNFTADVFLHERATGRNRVVTVHAAGLASRTPIGSSTSPSISADGRYVAFASTADELVPGQVDRNAGSDVFLYDRATRRVVLVSRSTASPLATGDGASAKPLISRDGDFIAFESRAGDLVPGQADQGLTIDVFLYHRPTGTITLVSRSSASALQAANGFSSLDALSADGGTVVFTSAATDLVPGQVDTNDSSDLFAYDRRTGTVLLVSHKAGAANRAANGYSVFNSMTPDGTILSFASTASDLVAGVQDTNGDLDLFLQQRSSGKTTLLSGTGRGASRTAATGIFSLLSADGRFVAFSSLAPRLVPGQYSPSLTSNVFLLDRKTGRVRWISRPAVAGAAAHAGSELRGLSDDGRFLLFESMADNFVPGQVDTNGSLDVFLFDRLSGKTALVSHVPGSAVRAGSGGSVQSVLKPDGRYVAFFSAAADLLSPPAPDSVARLLLYDRISGAVSPVLPPARHPDVRGLVFSALADFLAFSSTDPGLVPMDFNGRLEDVFLYGIPVRGDAGVSSGPVLW